MPSMPTTVVMPLCVRDVQGTGVGCHVTPASSEIQAFVDTPSMRKSRSHEYGRLPPNGARHPGYAGGKKSVTFDHVGAGDMTSLLGLVWSAGYMPSAANPREAHANSDA